MKSALTRCIALIACLTLVSCSGIEFLRVSPSCQLNPPAPALTQACPKEMAPQVVDSKGGTLLLNHRDARETYDACSENHKGLATWAKDAVDRCVKNSRDKLVQL